MKRKFLATVLFVITVSGKLYAQSFDTRTGIIGNYQLAQYQMEHLPKQGYSLDFGKGNSLFIPRADYTKIGSAEEINGLMDSAKNILSNLQDSLGDETNSKIVFIRFTNKGQLVSIQKPVSNERDYWFSNDSKSIVKKNQDTLVISIGQTINNEPKGSIFVFSLNHINDFAGIIKSGSVGKFVDKINNDLPANINSTPFYKKFITGNYTSNNDGTLSGKMNVSSNRVSMITLGVSADIQNVKNYFVPSASVDIEAYNTYKNYSGSSNGIGISWNPYFFFQKDNSGATKTCRNDFVFLSYFDISDKNPEGKFNIYLPLSIGYLVHRSGNFLEKNTFGINAFGVKYGNATLKPFLYFNNFFKGVTPSIQLSIGIGK